MDTAFQYLDDNFLLTQRLLDLPHKKFVYISSLDVYPRLGRPVGEDEDVDLSQLTGPYVFTKLFSDIVVQRRAANFLILRPTTLLGPVLRPNTTLRALTERGARLFLAGDSRFNYVLHEDVAAFIDLAIEADLTGIYNIASQGSVVLADAAEQLGLAVQFGTYKYDIGPVDAGRAAELLPAFARPSWQTLNRFIDSLGSAFVGEGRLRKPSCDGSRPAR